MLFESSQAEPKLLVPDVFDYNDGITDNQINDMRVRAHQRAQHALREK